MLNNSGVWINSETGSCILSREEVRVKIDSDLEYNHYLFKQLDRIQKLEILLQDS